MLALVYGEILPAESYRINAMRCTQAGHCADCDTGHDTLRNCLCSGQSEGLGIYLCVSGVVWDCTYVGKLTCDVIDVNVFDVMCLRDVLAPCKMLSRVECRKLVNTDRWHNGTTLTYIISRGMMIRIFF